MLLKRSMKATTANTTTSKLQDSSPPYEISDAIAPLRQPAPQPATYEKYITFRILSWSGLNPAWNACRDVLACSLSSCVADSDRFIGSPASGS